MPEGTDWQVERRMALAREWDELVQQARRIEGFEDFLRAPKLESLLPAARNGPLALVNVSRWRCDAIIVTAVGIDVVRLRDLSLGEVRRRAEGYLATLQNVEQAVRELLLARRAYEEVGLSLQAIERYNAANRAVLHARSEMESGLASVAEWLWDCIADPVLRALGIHDAPPAGAGYPRLWWCPTGLLNLLPLHAAGYHGAPQEGDAPRTVIDRVVSSYTPTLRALSEASQPKRAPGGSDERMLVVALAETPGQLSLPAVKAERDLLADLFADRHTLLEGENATWESVRAALPHHVWVHFSCHGGQDLSDPSRGGLLLSDRTLTVEDVSATRNQGEFAFLSACKTATGGLTLTDEVITLAAALHYTGYRHVIGTLWSVYDRSAAAVAAAVYTELTSGGRFSPVRSAYALHAAAMWLRDTDPSRPSTWMPFVHIGP
ncbi:CHAT domain-containing protein [Streptomyces cyaneofuscatus]|uniref:CHAT domain-containing protein n=1 Tax=Streptomyces cyaneofuscatus TaxID=66883 RepID=UPI0036D78889